jgi:hypothetical protein
LTGIICRYSEKHFFCFNLRDKKALMGRAGQVMLRRGTGSGTGQNLFNAFSQNSRSDAAYGR